MGEELARPLTGAFNKKINNKQPTHNEGTAAIFNMEYEYPHSKVSVPSENGIIEAKDWVDNGSKL